MKKQFYLEGLDCADCARKMEEAAKKVNGVKFLSVNFISMKLTLSADDEIFDKVFDEVVRVSAKVEPECKILPMKYKMDKDEKNDLYRIVISGVIFLAVKLLEEFEVLAEGSLLSLLLYLPAYIIAGFDIVEKAVKNIFHGKIFDENFLMVLATVGAVGTGEYSEAVAVMVLFRLGEFFQDIAVAKSRREVTELMDIRPDYAQIIENGEIKKVAPETVPEGSVIVIEPGEKIPIDSQIVEGESFLDTKALTGESVPKRVVPGDEILSGSINMNGVIKAKTLKSFGESSVSKILDLIENSGDKKSQAENFISKFAKYYTPIVVIGAFIIGIVIPVFFGNFSMWLHKAITCLVISCPCALVISVPLSFFGGIGGAGAKGILVKGADSIEKLAKTKTVVFDKTGTLTKGNFEVTAIHPDITNPEEILELAAVGENYSNHPISMSLKAAFNKEIDRGRIGNVEEVSGMGVIAEIDGNKICIGNEVLMEKVGAKVVECPICHNQGTIVHVSRQNEYLGHIVISDEIKEGSASAVAKLKKFGVKKLCLFSGDSKKIGDEVGKKLDFDEVRSELLPQDKVSYFNELKSQNVKNEYIAFVGDGMNDVPILASADVGIAMGGIGADAAIETADVVLMDDDPEKVATAIKISKKTLSIVYQNITFAIGVKLAVLIPNLVLGEESVPLWLAIFADVGVCVLAILNSARTLRIKD